MDYPTLDEVNLADHLTICRWYRFLPGPGIHALGKNNFHEMMEAEAVILTRIMERLKEFGGFTPEISKILR